MHKVFADFCELSALAISNSVDRIQFAAREERYLHIVKGYEPAEVEKFPLMLAILVDWLQCGLADCLGELFMSLELGDHWKGQFFTPSSVASAMAHISLHDVKKTVEREGFVSICEPACGAGGMLIACAEAVLEQGVNYQTAMHVTAIDIDATAAHMAYVQLSLLNVPAIVIHGNALSLEQRSHWVTPAHVLGGWDRRLRRRSSADTPGAPQHAQEDSMRPASSAYGGAEAVPIEERRARVVEQRLAEQKSLF
ncbi:N-6 DNA methylase [Variovorax sp. YR216]|uniref:N-6 DNA methylase n=1 Tax=Variovorax sp. YR216 TaxID=1882828 RepID=UPI0015A21E7A|nr:N-6 DNA methylase [Variovorax sp. YR216]